MRRFATAIAIAAALAIPVAGLAAGVSAPAGATTATSSVVCSKLTGTITGSVKISSCTPHGPEGNTASGSTLGLEDGQPITWTPNGATTTTKVSFASGSGECPTSDSQYDVTGSVTAVTGTTSGPKADLGKTYVKVGDAVSITVCVTSSGAIENAKGTKIDL